MMTGAGEKSRGGKKGMAKHKKEKGDRCERKTERDVSGNQRKVLEAVCIMGLTTGGAVDR